MLDELVNVGDILKKKEKKKKTLQYQLIGHNSSFHKENVEIY